MMKNGFKNIIFLAWAIVIAQLIFAFPARAADVVADSSGLFDNGILQGMHLLMTSTYKTMGNVLMVGHALMCYAINVDKTSVFGLVDVPNIGLLLVGLSIYVVGIFMSLSVGMYFVDASLRLGVAIIFLPISIALWPFPPTSNKFADNLSTIIRNGLLFMLMSVGVAFAVCLIDAGLFEGGDQAFWYAIEKEQTEVISENFSFFSTHILVVGFSLVFGFRILESSVNDYLNSFFSDAMFGSQSPMNQMGTQAFGMVAQNVAKPAMEFAKDVATHQTGRLISGAGDLLTADGRKAISEGLKSIKHATFNPRQTYNQAMQEAGRRANEGLQKLGEKTNQAIQSAGEGAKSAADWLTAFAPIPWDENERQNILNGEIENGVRSGGFNSKVDNLTKKWGNAAQRKIDSITPKAGAKTEEIIAHGGGEVKEASKKAVTRTVATMTGESPKDVRADLHEAKVKVEEKVEAAADAISSTAKSAVDKLKQTEFAQGFKEGLNQSSQTSDQTTPPVSSQNPAPVTPQAQGQEQGQTPEPATSPEQQTTPPAQGQEQGQTPVTPVALSRSENISEPFRNVEDPVAKMRQLSELQNTQQNSEEGKKGGVTRYIARKSGQIVAYTKKQAGKKADTLGRTLHDFGNWLGDNSNREAKDNKSWIEKWNEIERAERKLRDEESEEREMYREMDVGDR